MITSYEVGAIFKIADDATPTIARVAAEARALADAVKMARAELTALGRMPGISTISRQVSTLNRNLITMQASARAAAGAMAQVAAVGPWGAVPGGGGGGGGGRVPRAGGAGGGGGRGWPGRFHISGFSQRIPGGHAYMHAGSNTAMVAGGALAYGVYEEAELEDATARMMLTIPGAAENPAQANQRRQQIRKLLQDTAAQTGAPLGDLEEAILTGIRQFAGMPFDDRMSAMPGLLQAAAAEAKIKGKGTTVTAAMESMTGLAHMFRVYDPAGIAKMANAFAYISAVDPEKLPQIERAASYVIPRTRAIEIDPMQELLLVGAMQRAGVTSTKAGTWISALAQRAMPGTSLMSRVAFEKHEKALRMMGLVDDAGKPTWFDDAGKPDILKLLSIAGARAQAIPIAQRGGIEQALFGTQGAGAFGLLADPMVFQQIMALQKEMPGFRTGLPIFERLQADSPVQQARQAWADLRNVLIDIGTIVLPPLTTGLRGLDETLKALAAHWPAQGRPGGLPARGTLGEALGRGMAEGVIPGAALGWWMGGPWTGAAVGAFIGGAYEGGKYLWNQGGGLPTAFGPVGAAMPPAAGAAPGAGQQPVNMNVTVKAETDNPDHLADAIMRRLVDMLHTSGLFNQAQGQGSLDSTFTAGGSAP